MVLNVTNIAANVVNAHVHAQLATLNTDIYAKYVVYALIIMTEPAISSFLQFSDIYVSLADSRVQEVSEAVIVEHKI